MKKEVKEYKVPILTAKFNELGEITEITETGEFDTIIETHIYADEGKVFVDLSNNKVCGNHIQLGTGKSEQDYKETKECFNGNTNS